MSAVHIPLQYIKWTLGREVNCRVTEDEVRATLTKRSIHIKVRDIKELELSKEAHDASSSSSSYSSVSSGSSVFLFRL
jgi:hypothetical protein